MTHQTFSQVSIAVFNTLYGECAYVLTDNPLTIIEKTEIRAKHLKTLKIMNRELKSKS